MVRPLSVRTVAAIAGTTALAIVIGWRLRRRDVTVFLADTASAQAYAEEIRTSMSPPNPPALC
jgi:hypothetical protein